jgi:LL-diaminopimelate aminotransferase
MPISDGANSDAVNILELFGMSNVIGITDPPTCLPDASICRAKDYPPFLHRANNFAPLPPGEHCDSIYLCSPNNPTGVAMTRSQMQTG